MKLSLFFRHPEPEFHSIEQLFDTISDNFPIDLIVEKIYAKYKSKGIFKRINIAVQSSKQQADINHITGYIHFIAPFLKKKKTILTIHDIGSIKTGNIFKKFILKLFWFSIPAKSVAYITVISEFTKKELLSYIKINPEKVIVIPNCISPIYKFSEKEFNPIKPVILQIGTKKNKNLKRLIIATKNISCKLIIVGKLNNEQINLLKQYKPEYKNYFNIEENALFNLYKQADIVSFISTYEGFGLPVIEANATGRVVLCSNIEPINTIADNAALKVNPYNIDEIKNGIQKIIEDNSLRKTLINNGISNSKKYQAKEIAQQYYNLYLKLYNKL